MGHNRQSNLHRTIASIRRKIDRRGKTWGQGDRETRGQGGEMKIDNGIIRSLLSAPLSPCLPVPMSPRLLVSLSPRLLVPLSPRLLVPLSPCLLFALSLCLTGCSRPNPE